MKSHFFRIFYLIIYAFILTAIPLNGQINKDIRFTTINNTNGLPGNTITAITKDDLGFIWIGTSDGLCRYEGQNIVKVYRANQPEIEGGLENSNIRSLFLDSKENLWIGTRLGGLTKFHQPSATWKTYRNDPNNPQTISNDEILVINEDEKGRIWVGTEDGLNVFDPETEIFTSFKSDKNNPDAIRGKAVLSICIDNQQNIWAGTWDGGINLLTMPKGDDFSKVRFRHFYPSEDDGSKNVWKIYQDRQNHYWIATRGSGLFLMNVPEGLAKQTPSKEISPSFYRYTFDINKEKQTISNNHLEDIYQDVKGNLWIGTVNGLSCIFSKEYKQAFNEAKEGQKPDLRFHSYTNDPKESTSIINNSLTTIFEDNQGVLWFGTYAGVSQYNFFVNQFEVFDLVEDISKTPNTQNLYIDQNGTIWFGFGSDGILKYDPKTGKKNLHKLKNDHLKDNYVNTIYSPDDKYLYIGSQKGIIVLNIETNESTMYDLKEVIEGEEKFQLIRSLFTDNKNRIWISTLTGLYVINQDTGISEKYNHSQDDPTSISDNSINQITQVSNGDIWISSFHGLNVVIDDTPGKMKFKSFKHDASDSEHSLPSNRTTALVELDGTLFVGSNSGITGYDLEDKKFTNYNKNNKKSIKSLEKTSDGNIWASTTEGLLFFNPETGEYINYDQKDGLENNQFQSGSSYYDKKGYLYFASRQGVTRFHPVNLSNNETPPPVHVTDIRKMSPEGTVQSVGTYQEEVIVAHDEYYISIDFTALNYNRPEKNKYAFMLEGFDDKWNYPEGKTTAVYTNLRPGTYTFKVKAANNDGLWNHTGTSIKIVKSPAFWETWWFLLSSILLVIGLIYLAFKWYTRNIKNQNKRLESYNSALNQEIAQRKEVEAALHQRDQQMESLVKQRTKQLEIKNKEVKKLLKTIRERNDHLEIEIDKRTKNLLDSNKELQRSNKDLEQFAYIASHDLQEPLRVVGNFIGLLRRRYQQHFDEQAFQYIDFAVDGVQRMSEQIKNVLIFSKVSQKEIVFRKADINKVIETKLHDLSEKIEEKKVRFKIENMPEVVCEPMQIEMIFFNLISNAIKFNKNENPFITISNLSTEEDGFWHFAVKDNGIGIEKKYQDKIFEIFRRLHNKSDYAGTGIGLALCQKIVHRHQGKIWVESVPGEGTTFHFTISKLHNTADIEEQNQQQTHADTNLKKV